jgi:AmmeMemoRadiSam system protein A
MRTKAGAFVVSLARAAISQALGIPARADERAPWLQEPGASFVTLRLAGELRGCVGSVEVRRLLLEDIKANAVAAAFRDPRFAPLQREEWAESKVEVSILSPLEPMCFDDEAHALGLLQPGVDGVVLRMGGYASTFLPQVWDSLPEAREFMAHLKRKAGLPADFWSDEVQLMRYTVEKFGEDDLDA